MIAPGGGEVVGDSPDRRVEILSDHPAVHATWSRFGPGREGADLHVHRRHSDLFYVLDGELTVRVGPAGEEVVARAGTLALLPPLVVHGFANRSHAEVRYLNLHAPGQGFADFLRALRDVRTLAYDQEPPPADGGRPPGEAVVDGAAFRGEPIALRADVEEIAVAELTGGPGDAPPLHRHARHVESLYVLEGAPALTVGDRELGAEAGSWIQLPPGVPHRLAFPEPARILEIHTPNCGYGALLRALHDGGDEPAVAAARTAFDEQPG